MLALWNDLPWRSLGHWRRIASAATLLCMLAAPERAGAETPGVTIQFSDGLKTALGNAGKDAAKEQGRLQKDVNDGLRALGETNADAKALYDSGQTLKIVCFGDADATKEGLEQRVDLFGAEPAATKGDFDAAGRPKPKGTAIIAIDCDALVRAKGFEQPAVPDGASMFEVLVHELLHAANAARRHPPDKLDTYEDWVRAFVAALANAKAAPPPATDSPSPPATVPVTPPPGTTPPGTPAPTPPEDPRRAALPSTPNYAFNVNVGGNASWTPRVSGGTVIPQLGVAGTELPLVWSPGTLTGASFQMDAKIPLGDPIYSGRDWTFVPRVSYGYADASASGMIAPGGVFTGRTYLSPNPVTGATGLFYGSTGQSVEIKSHIHQVGLDLVVGTDILRGAIDGWRYNIFAGGGFSYRFDWTGHRIDERNLSFDKVGSRTEFTTEDHFFGARLAAGVKVENGRWHGALAGHVTPGVVVSMASARQWNVCAACSAPAERSFMLEHERHKTGFGVRAGIGATVAYNLTRSISVGMSAQFDYSSRHSNWRNPVTPQKSPPHLGVDDAFVVAFGVRIRAGFYLP